MFQQNNNKGGLLVLMIPLAGVLFLFIILMINIGHAYVLKQTLQTIVDGTLLSSLRLRAQGLERIASRWTDFGQHFISGDPSGVSAHPKDWDVINREAQRLGRGLSGYKARMTAVVKVVSDANFLNRDNIELKVEPRSKLGIQPQDLKVRLSHEDQRILKKGWYRREWAEEEINGFPDSLNSHKAQVTFKTVGIQQDWLIKQKSNGLLTWDINEKNPLVRTKGNGGFPRRWNESLDGNQVHPYRYPLFGGELAFDD